jgi:acyl-CoA thioester hydrolase
MARIQIQMPEKFVFATEIPIRIGDINFTGHLGFDSLLSIIAEARLRFLQNFGYQEDGSGRGFGFIVTDVNVTYVGQGYYGQTLKIEMAATGIAAKGFDVVYRVSDVKTGREIARAMTAQLIYDRGQKKVVPLPDDFREKLSA